MPPLWSEKVASDPEAEREQSTTHEDLGTSAQQKSKTSGSKIHNITNNDTDQKDLARACITLRMHAMSYEFGRSHGRSDQNQLILII